MFACEIYKRGATEDEIATGKAKSRLQLFTACIHSPHCFFQELNAVWLFHTTSPCMCQGQNEKKKKKDKTKDSD